jgi:regulator of protease activity HflC (stomatin/prohibitin superfamily)
MNVLIVIAVAVVALFLLGAALAVKIIKQYEQGVLFRLGRVLGVREPGLRVIIPFVDVLHREGYAKPGDELCDHVADLREHRFLIMFSRGFA